MTLAGAVSVEWSDWKPERSSARENRKRGRGGLIMLMNYFSFNNEGQERGWSGRGIESRMFFMMGPIASC